MASLRFLLGAQAASPWRRLLSTTSSPSSLAAAALSSSSSSTASVEQPGDLLLPAAAAAADPNLFQPGVVIYDGVCYLCHSGVKWLMRADKHRMIKFCCVQSMAAEPYLGLCGLTREDVLRIFLFVEGPGLYHQASTAALTVASHLPLPYSALSALLIVPTPLRDAVYDYVAKRRYNWFGKENECIVLQEEEMLDRFIDREELFRKSKRKKYL